MQDFRKLKIWEKSLDLSLQVYKVTDKFPKEEKYGIISQMRRASNSVGANIAEGSSRSTKKDFSNFLNIALGSLAELDFFTELFLKLKFIKRPEAEKLYIQINEIRKMIIGLKKKLKT